MGSGMGLAVVLYHVLSCAITCSTHRVEPEQGGKTVC